MAKKIQSDILESVGSLIQVKDATMRDNRDAIERRDIVHKFTNLRDTMTEEEKNEAGREEIINFGSTFRSAQVNIAPLESIVIGTDSLVETVVDLNDENRDHLISVEIGNAANDWLFNGSEKFQHFWRTGMGEGYLTGGGPAVFDDQDSGLYPRYNKNFFFPAGTKLDPDEMTYAFERIDMTMSDLEEILAETEDDDEEVSVDVIKQMIEDVKKQIEGEGAKVRSNRAGVSLDEGSARDNCMTDRTTIEVWKYWEVRTYNDDYKTKSKRGQRYVSSVLFLDSVTVSPEVKDGKRTKNSESVDAKAIIHQEEAAFDEPREWLTMLVFDEEVGGEKTVDTLRGIAEAYYKPAVLIEELRNVEIEGAMQSARITLQEGTDTDPDEVLDFELGRDLFAPKGVEAFQLPNTGAHLRPIVSDLMGTVSSISSSDNRNTGRGQELRQQALERQQNSDIIKTNRVIKAYLKLDQILDLIVGRALTLDPEPGTEDYRVIKGFQKCVDEKIADILQLSDEVSPDALEDDVKSTDKASEIRKKIGKREYGRFCNLRVKARRNALGLDRPTEVENAAFILRMVETGRVPAQNVPALMERAIAYQTQNPDLAGLMANKPELISTDQQERAAAEWPTIIRRVSAGEVLPIGPRDIDEDHVISHTIDLIAFVNSHGLRPWDQLSVAEFTGAIQHIAAHIQRMRERPESAGVARELMIQLQEIVQQATAIIQVLEEQRAEQENEDLSPDDRLKIAKEQETYLKMDLLARKFGVDIEDKIDTMRNRVTRAQQNQERLDLMSRQGVVNEINKDRDYQLKRYQALTANP